MEAVEAVYGSSIHPSSYMDRRRIGHNDRIVNSGSFITHRNAYHSFTRTAPVEIAVDKKKQCMQNLLIYHSVLFYVVNASMAAHI